MEAYAIIVLFGNEFLKIITMFRSLAIKFDSHCAEIGLALKFWLVNCCVFHFFIVFL